MNLLDLHDEDPLGAKGRQQCDDQDEDEDGQTHGDPDLLLHGDKEAELRQ